MNGHILFLCCCRCKPRASPEEFALIQEISTQIKERQNAFFDMEAYLPKKNGYVLHRGGTRSRKGDFFFKVFTAVLFPKG